MCAVAQKRGIVGLIIDGVIRDLAEIREMAKELKIDPEPIIKGFIGHDPVSFGDEGTGKTHKGRGPRQSVS